MANSDSPSDVMLRTLGAHTDISPMDAHVVRDLTFTSRRLDAGAYLVRESEVPDQCGVLLSGFAIRQKLTGDGTRQIISIHLPGDLLDLQHLFLGVADHNVQALTKAEIAVIPRQTLRGLARSNTPIGQAILVLMLVEASILREWVLNIGRRGSRARLAHLLCEFAARFDAIGLAVGNGYELPMTQEQLADALGLTPVHVNRILRAFNAEGLITRQRRLIGFPALRALHQLADFNARYLHFDHQPAG